MKARAAIAVLSLVWVSVSEVSEAAVVAPAGGAHQSFSPSFNSTHTWNGRTSARSYNATINSTSNNGSASISSGRAVRGVPSYDTYNIGAYSPYPADGSAASRTINGTVISSYNNPNGAGSSMRDFNDTFPATGNMPTTPSLFNQPLGDMGYPSAGPYYPGGGAYLGAGAVGAYDEPAAYGYDGGYLEEGGPAVMPQSGAASGPASVISAAAQYNRDTADAAVKATKADSQAMKNEVDRVKTFYAARETGRVARENERGPHPDAQELAGRAHVAVPSALTTNQIDPVNGDLHWPGFFQDPRFDRPRLEINDHAVNWVRYGELSFYDRTQMRENINKLFDDLNSKVKVLPPQEYTTSREFLSSLLYATTHSMLEDSAPENRKLPDAPRK